MKKKVVTYLHERQYVGLEGISEDYECSKSHVLRVALITLFYFLHMEQSGRLTYFHIQDKLSREKDYS